MLLSSSRGLQFDPSPIPFKIKEIQPVCDLLGRSGLNCWGRYNWFSFVLFKKTLRFTGASRHPVSQGLDPLDHDYENDDSDQHGKRIELLVSVAQS